MATLSDTEVAAKNTAADANNANNASGANALGSNVISSASTQPTPTFKPGVAPTDTTDHTATTKSVTQQVIDDYAGLKAKQDTAQSGQSDLSKTISDLINSEGGKTADTQAANTIAGVDTATIDVNKYTQQLADLNSQASSLNREAQAAPILTQENSLGGTERSSNDIVTNDALRKNALKALSLGQQSDIAHAALTGSSIRLQAAKDKAQQIVDLKYAPIEAQLKAKQAQYDLNKDALSEIDKKASDALQVSLKKEADDLATKKENDKSIQDMIIDANAQQAPASVIQSAKESAAKGGSPADVATIIGKYSGAAGKAMLLQEQIKTEQATRAKLYSDINKNNNELLSVDEAAKLGVPYGTTKAQAAAQAQGQVGKPAPLNPTQTQALSSAQTLMDKLNNDFGGILQPNAPVGTIDSKGFLLNQKRADFVVQFNNLKGLLALDAAKLVKGQGALSDSERQILDAAASNLARNQSPEDFKKNLQTIIDKFKEASPDYQYANTVTSLMDTTGQEISPDDYARNLLK